MYDLYENEHQELFYLAVNPTGPISIEIPSPLGPLGYYLYVRVPSDRVADLGSVGARLDVDGYHEDHVQLKAGEGVPAITNVPSKISGTVWVCLGQSRVSRGDGILVLTGWPANLTCCDLLLCTWPRFVESGQADDWMRVQSDPRWSATGVPLGGIGTGRVDFCRDGRFRNFSMNNNQDAPIENPDGIPGAYLSVTCDGETIDLSSRPIVEGHRSANLRISPFFPQIRAEAINCLSSLDVTVTLSGVLCPHDLRTSSIPGFIVRWSVRNRSDSERKVRVKMGWPNLIGVGGGISGYESSIGYGDGSYHHWNIPTGQSEELVEGSSFLGVRYKGNPGPNYQASAGEHILAIERQNGLTPFADPKEKCAGADLSVPARGEVQATLTLTTAMPNWIDTIGVNRGHYWSRHFASALAIAEELSSQSDTILEKASALARFISDSDLPEWLEERLSNCLYPLVTNSVLFEDGRFSINEGPTEMAGCYGTIDQRLAAHPATQIFFPELNAQELTEFAAIQGESGGICHDLGSGNLERKPGEASWPDLTCSFILQTAKHAWSTGDTTFEREMWPHVRKALLRHAVWAIDGGGVAQVGNKLGTSYDGYHYYGTTGYMGTLWLAAMAACEKWAHRMGDEVLPSQIQFWRKLALRRLEADLWNGRYFISYGSQTGPRRETCHAGQLAGQVFTRMLTGQNVMPDDRLLPAVEALLALNGNEMNICPPDEADDDGKAASTYSWLPYVEGFMLTAPASLGDMRMVQTWQRMMEAVSEGDAHPCDTRLMYRPSTGEQSWGSYYMTAPASWLVYDALLDFFYCPTNGALRLRHAMPGRLPVVHPLFWAMADVDGEGTICLDIRNVFSEKPIEIRQLEVPVSVSAVELDGFTAAPGPQRGVFRTFSLPSPFTIEPGSILRWKVITF